MINLIVRGGGCFLERLCFLLFIVQKSGFYLLRYEWNPSSAPHPPNFQRVVKLFILAGFRHTRYCWFRTPTIISWYGENIPIICKLLPPSRRFRNVVEKSDEPGVFIEACPPPMRDPFFNGIFTYMDAIYPIISTIHVGPVNIAVHQVILPPVLRFFIPDPWRSRELTIFHHPKGRSPELTHPKGRSRVKSPGITRYMGIFMCYFICVFWPSKFLDLFVGTSSLNKNQGQ